MIVCSSWRMLSSWSFVVWVASNKNVSNAIQPPYLLLEGWSASWHINPLSNALSVVLDTAIKCTVVDHYWIYMISTFWKYIPPLGLESVIFILWDASKHAEKSLIWDRSIVWIDCLHCVHDMLRCCCYTSIKWKFVNRSATIKIWLLFSVYRISIWSKVSAHRRPNFFAVLRSLKISLSIIWSLGFRMVILYIVCSVVVVAGDYSPCWLLIICLGCYWLRIEPYHIALLLLLSCHQLTTILLLIRCISPSLLTIAVPSTEDSMKGWSSLYKYDLPCSSWCILLVLCLVELSCRAPLLLYTYL